MINFLLTILGVFIWSLTEYLLHRFLGHEKNWSKVFKKEHFNHHRNNDQYAKIWHKVLLSSVVGSLFFIILYIFLPFYYALSISIGFVFGYALNEYIHKGIHTGNKLIPSKLFKHHMNHHKLYPLDNYGVITDKWDLIFRTKK